MKVDACHLVIHRRLRVHHEEVVTIRVVIVIAAYSGVTLCEKPIV